MKAELVPDNGDPPIPITRDVTVIGRKDYCDVKIDHHSLSKRHCVVVKTDGLLVIRDLATTNGTKVKGQKVRWAALLPDDRIALGAYKMRVYLGSDDALSPSQRPGGVKTVRLPGPGGLIPKGPGPTPSTAPPLKAEPVFSEPSPSGGLEVLEDDSGDSGWRKLITSDQRENDDVIIELE